MWHKIKYTWASYNNIILYLGRNFLNTNKEGAMVCNYNLTPDKTTNLVFFLFRQLRIIIQSKVLASDILLIIFQINHSR